LWRQWRHCGNASLWVGKERKRKEERKKGRKEERKKGRKEERKKGRKEERKKESNKLIIEERKKGI
jgi:hypothetical protein